MILDLIDRWYKRRFVGAELKPYESACLEVWKQRLPDEQRLLLENQLARFDYVERLADGKQVNFWRLGEQPDQWPEDLCFRAAAQRRVVVAATVWLRRKEPRSRARLRADITVYRGRFFSIEFDKPPSAYFGTESSGEPLVDEVAIRYDLAEEGPSAPPLADTGDLTGWLAEWDSRWQLSGVLEPQSEEDRKESLRGFDTVFPDDYLEALAQVGGFRVRNCKVFGLPGVQKIVHPDENYYVFAEVERAYIGARQGAETVEIYELHVEFDVQLYDSKSIRAVLEREMEASDD